MDIHEEIEELVNGTDLTIESVTETVPADEFDEIQEFLEATRNCTVGGLVYNKEGALLLVAHEDDTGWIQPGGMVEPGESIKEALEREVEEETGVEITIEDPFFVRRGEYTHKSQTIPWYSILFLSRATDSTIGEDLGLDGEGIIDAQWFQQLPDQLADIASRDRFREAMREIERRTRG